MIGVGIGRVSYLVDGWSVPIIVGVVGTTAVVIINVVLVLVFTIVGVTFYMSIDVGTLLNIWYWVGIFSECVVVYVSLYFF